MLLAASCHMDMPHNDCIIFNYTKDSLYYDIEGYGLVKDSIPNMAYERVTDLTTNKTIDTIPGYTLNPGVSSRPTIMNKTWKKFAAEKGGLTILFYKRNIERLPPKSPLTAKNIFRRIDLTTKQLDSLKYVIVLQR
jgi:hypothetical protein